MEVDSQPPAVQISEQLQRACHVSTVSSRSSSCGTGSGSEERGTPEPLRAAPVPAPMMSPKGRRLRTFSGSHGPEDHVLRTSRKIVYTAGRPPWYNQSGQKLREPFVIGICGGSASGKTTVANKIIESLDMPWVTLLSLDSFYKVLSPEQHELAEQNKYDFDHPDAFDFEVAARTLQKLREGKKVEVPVYNFTTHSREKHTKTMYGADVIIFEGILSFYYPPIVDLLDLKIFVDTDSDIRLARRLRRDTLERGRDIAGVIMQYNKTVKPAFDSFVAPCMLKADMIVPRGGENVVAIDLMVKHIMQDLTDRGYEKKKRSASANSCADSAVMPERLSILKQTPQVRGLHTFIRNRNSRRDEFIFYSQRLMRLLIEHALSQVPFETVDVQTPQGTSYEGRRRTVALCGVSILRAGETMEPALREVVKDCKMGKILIQTNAKTREPELYYLRLPPDIHKYHVLLMDATVATGAAAMMAIRVLLDHDVPEENILHLSLLMAATGAKSVAYAFPKVTQVTAGLDARVDDNYYIVPGLGNFGDRYFGTEGVRPKDYQATARIRITSAEGGKTPATLLVDDESDTESR